MIAELHGALPGHDHGGVRPALRSVALRADEDYLLIANEELPACLLKGDPFVRISPLTRQEKVELLFHGVALFNWNGVVLPVRQCDFKKHGPTLALAPRLDRVRASPPRGHYSGAEGGSGVVCDNRIAVVLLDDPLDGN